MAIGHIIAIFALVTVHISVWILCHFRCGSRSVIICFYISFSWYLLEFLFVFVGCCGCDSSLEGGKPRQLQSRQLASCQPRATTFTFQVFLFFFLSISVLLHRYFFDYFSWYLWAFGYHLLQVTCNFSSSCLKMLNGTWWPSIDKKLEQTISSKSPFSHDIIHLWFCIFFCLQSPVHLVVHYRPTLFWHVIYFPSNEKSIWLLLTNEVAWIFGALLFCPKYENVRKSMKTLSAVLINAWVWCDSSMVSWIPPCSSLSQLCLILLCIFLHLHFAFCILLIVLTNFCTTQHPIDQPNLWCKHCGFSLPPAWVKQTHCSNP